MKVESDDRDYVGICSVTELELPGNNSSKESTVTGT